MPTATNASPTDISIPEIDVRRVDLHLRGDSPLIVHAWSEKAKEMIRVKQQKRASAGRTAKNPDQEYQDAFYRCEDGTPGFPTIAFKAAAVDAASQITGLTKVWLRGVFHTLGSLVPIQGEPSMREDMVRVGMGVADIRYRPGFPEWAVTLPIRYNAGAFTIEMMVHLFNQAGFSVGVGEWRPAKDGPHGMFHVESVEHIVAPNATVG